MLEVIGRLLAAEEEPRTEQLEEMGLLLLAVNGAELVATLLESCLWTDWNIACAVAVAA